MFTKSGVLFPLGIAVGLASAQASAQQPAKDNPNALRPPVFLSYPLPSRQRVVIELYFAELRQAIRNADTTTLSALVPDFVIPAAERSAARRAGCESPGRAIKRLQTRASVAKAIPSADVYQVGVTQAGQGDTVAFGTARLVTAGGTSSFSVALTRAGHARSMARVQGLLLALCALPG